MPKNYSDSIDCTKLTEKWKTRDLTPFQVVEVKQVNFRPHPFCITPRHVAYASDHCGGILGSDVISKIPCDCGQPASAHAFDVVLLVKLTRNITKQEAQDALKPICDEVEKDGIDGFTFVETEEKFRIS